MSGYLVLGLNIRQHGACLPQGVRVSAPPSLDSGRHREQLSAMDIEAFDFYVSYAQSVGHARCGQ